MLTSGMVMKQTRSNNLRVVFFSKKPMKQLKLFNMVDPKYRVDLVLVPANSVELTAMQQKLNQWITTGQLVKYQTSVVGNTILFEIIRIKQGE